MLIYFFSLLSIIHCQCIENTYLQIPNSVEKQQSETDIIIRLEGEYIIGYGEDFKINDKSKIQILQSSLTFGPQNFEIYCPAVHIIPDEEEAKCEITVNMYQMNTTEDDNLAFTQLVIPVETNNNIRENPTLQFQNNFQLRLVDLAEQLKEVEYFVQYENCGRKIFILSDSLPITAEQIVILQNYSKQLASTARTEPITQLIKGTIKVENYTVDKRSTIHLFALCTIIFGVILLSCIRAFKKRVEVSPQNDELLNQQELKVLN
ncbi:unnamed protein product [Paramecium octaurelia]|uniref:Transmembrane protein n=1 Tax=Paramecium octaurelia TaxID=43137 RepID=A0A8S1WRI0_PAROT|nr:unnamed protein product [Paramecium octaurelia]CAD8191311.1 unnamed protein product [Paramecium octaurelia]CAD8191313.1 unnamed protein product [Paramecium octaurelia]